MTEKNTEVVAVVPAAGTASRLEPLPCSKELYPVGLRKTAPENRQRPRVVSHYLFEMLRMAQVKKAYVVIRPGKWDIPAYFRDGRMVDVKLAYLLVDEPIAVPYSLDKAFPFVKDSVVALGFPDVILRPEDSFTHLLRRLRETGADLVLGLYPTEQPDKMDMVGTDKDGNVKTIDIKPARSSSGAACRYAWQTAVWTPIFTEYLHAFVAAHKGRHAGNRPERRREHDYELFIGNILQAAIGDKLNVNSVVFPEGGCLDVGTVDGLSRALHLEFFGR